MISGWVLLLVSLAYVGGLFAIAWWGDRHRLYPDNPRLRPIIYSLALAVYCSSWTFYGAVGTAVRDGLAYLPIYLGPILFFLFALPFFERLVLIAKQQNATSIADLLAARFGRSSRIAIVITVIALTAVIPYIALQLKAVAMSVEVLTGQPHVAPASVLWYRDSALLVALLLAVFASLFGTRMVDAAEHHPGMMLAIAVESVVKLVALCAVGVFAATQLHGTAPLIAAWRGSSATPNYSMGFLTQTLVSFTAIFCLPRQFQVGVVECADTHDVRRARWWFPGYLALICLIVVPIAAAALSGGNQSPLSRAIPDAFVLWLPLSSGHDWLALLAYLGGFSAATGMVIVASVALATMTSNDLVLPALWRLQLLPLGDRAAASATILWIRRIAIFSIILAAYAYVRLVPEAPSLAAIGVLAFAAVAQFAPALIAGVHWSGASRAGVIIGVATGFSVWLYTLFVPAIATAAGDMPSWIAHGPFGWSALSPRALFGFAAPDSLTHGVFWSLLANVALLVGVSLRYPPTLSERLQASRYVTSAKTALTNSLQLLPGAATVGDLLTLAEQMLGAHAAQRLLQRYSLVRQQPIKPTQRADVGLLQALERELTGALGASSARLVLTSSLRGAGLKLGEVVTLFDEASQKLRFNRELLEAMMENVSQGISVVDADLRLIAWNKQWLDIFEYPEALVFTGQQIDILIRYNAMRGWCGPGDSESHVAKRLDFMRRGSAYISERRRPDGRVIEVRGQPLPEGGFVTTFSDVTIYKRVEAELREINDTLEQRVVERTEQLAHATTQAQQANLSKTRFVAAASHDLLQPLNAARLFNAALRGRTEQDAELQKLVERVDNSLHAAEELLDALLDISRLDAGAIKPEPADLAAASLLDSISEQFAPLALQRGIDFRVQPTALRVHTDPRMLRRVLQNFVANALRYTRSGGVVIGCRPRAAGAEVEFQVFDTGPGIPLASQRVIYEEFHRLDQTSPWGEKGLGLGLSICDRIARSLEATLTLQSVPGRGSAFGIRVARSHAIAATQAIPTATPGIIPSAGLRGLRVLCIDDDPNILDGMRELLTRWDVEVRCAVNQVEAETVAREWTVDVVLADFHLQGQPSGLDLLELLCRTTPRSRHSVGALITANASAELAREARARGFDVLHKPVKPAALRALIAALARRVNDDRDTNTGSNIHQADIGVL